MKLKTRFLTMLTAALLLGSSGALHAAWEFTATSVGGGSVDVTSGTYVEGDTIIVTASPDANGTNAFVKWTGDVTVAQKFEPVLRLTCSGGPDGTLNVTSHFGKAWYVAPTGDDTNDGLSLALAFATISNGIAAASAGDVVLVHAGDYDIYARLNVDTGITIRGVEGAEQTRITRRQPSTGSYGERYYSGMVQINHADAVVEGLYFYKSYSTSVTITTEGGTCRKCVISGSTFTTGVGLGVNMSDGLLSQCIITNNVGSGGSKGSGLYIKGGLAENCLIADNRADGTGIGGGVYVETGTVRNCTIVNNVSGNGAVYATRGATIENCIVWGNVVQNSLGEVVSPFWVSNPNFVNCYFPPLLTNENTSVFTDCIETNTPPSFRDAANGDYRLTLGSPCVDAGANAVVTGELDLDRNDRLVGAKVDIGAYEFDAGSTLICDVVAPQVEAIDTLDVALSAAVANAASGGTLTYAWTLNGAAAGSDDPTLDLSLTDPGRYTVGLTVGDGTSSATTIRTNLLYVVSQTLYVALVNPDAAFPYATPETAATDIQSAIDASRDGCTILVGPGQYLLTSTLEVSKGIALRSTDGLASTSVREKSLSTYIPVLQLGHPQALISGFDFDFGYRNMVNIWGNGGVVSNCTIQGGAFTSGVGAGLWARSGLVTHCLISGNTLTSGSGVGAYLEGDAVVENCLITNNVSTGKGCVYLTGNSVIRNCTIVANQTGNGAGVYTYKGGTVENCIITDNTITGTAGPGDPNWFDVNAVATYRNNCTPVDVGTACVTGSPNFLDAANGDYRISFESPCFNAGVNSASLIGGTDYYGNPRIAATLVDIGCHEATPPPGTLLSIR